MLAGDTAAFGHELGLAMMGETDGIKLRLRYRRGHQRRRCAGARQPGGQFQRIERAAGARRIGLARHDIAGRIDLENGRAPVWERVGQYVENSVVAVSLLIKQRTRYTLTKINRPRPYNN